MWENAGKTNTVEALQMLTAGVFRHPTPRSLSLLVVSAAGIRARFAGDGRVVDVARDITPQRRQFSRNGKHCQAADMPSLPMSASSAQMTSLSARCVLPP